MATRLKQSTEREPGNPKFSVPRALAAPEQAEVEFGALRVGREAVQAVALMEEAREAAVNEELC